MRHLLLIVVLVLVAISSSTGATSSSSLLRCSEESFAALGGSLPSRWSQAQYAICAGGIVYDVACPQGRQFEPSSQRCSADEVQSDLSAVKTMNDFEDLCTNPNEVQFFPNPTNCSQYVICYGLVPIEQSCSQGLLFNPALGLCDIPGNVVCGYSCPPVDDPFNPVWLPDAQLEDCARHYLCFQGEPILFFCPNNLYFDVRSKTCTFPQYSACRVPDVYCHPNKTMNAAHPRTCTSYYECESGFPHLRSCAAGEYFDPRREFCVVGVCPPTGETTTTTPGPQTSTTTNFTSTIVLSTTPSDFPTTELPMTVTLSTIPPTTTDSPSTPMTTGMETTVGPTTIDTSSQPTETTMTGVESTTSGVESTTGGGTTTTGFESTTVEASTSTDAGTTTEVESTTGAAITTESESTTEVFTTPTDAASTTDVDVTTEPATTTEVLTTTAEVTTTTELATTTEDVSTTAEATTTTELATTTTTEEVTTPSEVTTTPTEPPTTIDPSLFCAGISAGVLPYPGNCYQYILCLNGLGAISECGLNQIFNPVVGVCVPGDRVTCIFG